MRESLTSPNDRLRDGRLQLLRAPSRSQRWCRRCSRRSTRSRPSSSGRRWSARWRRSAGDDDPRVQRDAGRRGRPRPGLLPERGHRGARRLQGAVRVRRARDAIAKLDGPLQDDAALALGKLGDKRALEDARRAAAHRAASDAAVDCGGDLPARRQLRGARKLPDRDAEVRRQEPGLSGAAARASAAALARWPSPADRRRARRRAVRGRHSVARSDAGAGGARAGDGRAPEYAA